MDARESPPTFSIFSTTPIPNRACSTWQPSKISEGSDGMKSLLDGVLESFFNENMGGGVFPLGAKEGLLFDIGVNVKPLSPAGDCPSLGR